jgi:hypothetical protein
MKNFLLAMAATGSLFAAISPAFAQGTAFNYQGRLNDGTNAANGIYDLTFTLYTSSNAPIAGPITNSAIRVTNGLFSATLDFGNTFDGTPRWLEIAVRTNGAANFITLTPRQPLAHTPYAIFANTASNLSGTLPTTQLSGTVSFAASAGNAASLNGQPGSYYLNLANQVGTLAPAQLPAGTINSRGVLASDFELDELSGTTFADSSGLGNNATAPIGGIVAGSAGHSGKAVSFSGGYLKVTGGIPDSPQIAIEAWVNPQSLNNGTQTILSKPGAYQLQIINNQPFFAVFTAGASNSVVSSAGVAPGSWSHVAGYYDGLNVAVELNGTLSSTPFTGGPVAPSAGSPLYIGAADEAGAQPLSGSIDEVRIRTVSPPTARTWPQISYQTYSTANSTFNLNNSSSVIARSPLNFYKLFSTTRLRITYNDSIQVTGSGAVPVGAIWEVVLDGISLSTPLKFNYYDPQDTGVVLPLTLVGWDYGVTSGWHQLTVTLKPATTGTLNAFTGSAIGAALLQVEEMP